ncbi:MAG: hypothetical protein E7671_05535 [Ruminococcaceae bacterium]|nr:hypothetical protein [Oscillospiraceae bacterium]
MKSLKKGAALLLAFILVIPLVFCGPVSASGNDIPTIFIDNEAWYKYSILPLIRKNGEPCVPVSVFSGLDSFSESYDSVYNCYVISSEDRYISINEENGRYLTHSGEIGDITTDKTDRELYVSAQKIASVLEIKIETTVFEGTEVIRFCLGDSLQPLSSLIELYRSSSAIGGIGFEGGEANRRSVFSVITDISSLEYDDIRALLDMCDSTGIKMTFAADSTFMSQNQNLQFLTEIAAKGHSIAISINKKSKESPTTQAEKCNSVLYRIFKQKTLLILGKTDETLKSKGYKELNNLPTVTKTASTGNINFNKTRLILLDSVEKINLSKLTAITSAAKENGKEVIALNPLTGN